MKKEDEKVGIRFSGKEWKIIKNALLQYDDFDAPRLTMDIDRILGWEDV